MRRPLLLLTVTLCVLGSLFLFLTYLAESAAAASEPEVPEGPAGPVNQDLSLAVNYAHDWVAGAAISGTTVAVTVTDSGDAIKNTATVTSDPAGEYFVNCEDWDVPECPDVQPGDKVTVTAGGLVAAVNPVGEITGELDEVENTVSGVVNAPGFSGTLTVTCMIWVDVEVTPVETLAEANEGAYSCDFDDVSWDLAPGDRVAVMYSEPDGDGVINVFQFPWARVNYAHDWVGADYEAGHTFWITVSDDVDSVKATAQIDSVYLGGWEGDGFETQPEEWSPEQPDIVPGDSVEFQSDDGYNNLLKVGEINGELDVDADAISGTLKLPGSPRTLDIECHPWGAWEFGEEAEVITSTAGSKGSPPYSCSWAGEWDIVPGRDVAVMYLESNTDRVINVFREDVPHLQINKYAQGEAGEDGNLMFRIEYWNDGDAPAENVVLTDTMEGMSYLYDTSPFPTSGGPAPGGEYVVFDLGVVEAQNRGDFSLYVSVDGVVSGTITNTVEITTTNPYDEGEAEEKISQWVGLIVEGDTYLNVGKQAWTGDPLPDSNMIFAVNVCNDGATGSSYLTLTDTLHPALSVQGWWSEQPGWQELSTGDSEIVLANPSVPGGWCSEVNLEVKVSDALVAGDFISNTAVITAANDLDGDDNEAFWEGQIGEPRVNLALEKWWNWGMLVPGGELHYQVSAHNEGNVPLASFRITDTLPVSTTFLGSWTNDPAGQQPFDPLIVTDDYVVWEIDPLANGFRFEFEVAVDVDPEATPGTLLVNTVESAPQPGEGHLRDNTSSWTETLYGSGVNLRVFKEHEWLEDGSLDYRIRFENVGDAGASDLWVTDTLPQNAAWAGWWGLEFDEERLLETAEDAGQLAWRFSELLPGETGWLHFGAIPDEPGEPLRWYSNTVEITLPPGDANPGDNVFEDFAFSGGEVRLVELWVETANSGLWGEALPGSNVTVTTASGQFFTVADPECGGCWNVDDIGPIYAGDIVTVSAYNGLQPVVIDVPDPFSATADSASRSVWGQVDHLDGEWLEVQLEGGPQQSVQTDASGNYSANFDEFPRGGGGEVRYWTEISYAQVGYHRAFRSPDLLLDVNYAHDAVAGRAAPDTTVTVTITTSTEEAIIAASQTTDGDGFFEINCESWPAPQCPDLQPGQWAIGLTADGYTSTVQIGSISGLLDLEADTISGNVEAPWPGDLLPGNCSVWVEGGPGFEFTVDSEGGSYFCDFSTAGWDLEPGQEVGVRYFEPDNDSVVNVFAGPVPNIHIEKRAEGEPAVGGNIPLVITYWNDGDAPAEEVVITDAMEGLSYISDTLGLPHTGSGGGPIVWQLGPLEAGSWGEFVLFAGVDAGAGGAVTNTAEISTSNPYEQGGPEELVAQWNGIVSGEGSSLNLGKSAWTEDPAAGEDLVFELHLCNESPNASSQVTLTDTLHPSMTLQSWWAGYPGWYEVSATDSEVVLALPSAPGDWCSQIFLRATLSSDAVPGMPLSNTATVTAANDVNVEDNSAYWEGVVGEPRVDLSIDKWWSAGTLLPGGTIIYGVQAHNEGNLPVEGPITISDVLPAETSFVASWWADDMGQHPFAPVLTTAGYVVWEIPTLDNGYGFEFEVELQVDGGAAPGTILTNTAEISPQAEEENYANNVSVWVETLGAPGPNLRIRKEGDWSDWGEETRQAVYRLSIENTGDEWIGPVSVSDTYPSGMALDGEPDADWERLEGWGDDPGDHVLTATFSYLAPGETTWFDFAAVIPGDGRAPSGLIFTNTAEVEPVAEESNLDDNLDEVVLTTGPDLYVEKELIGGQPRPGELVTFSLRYGNDRPEHEWWWNLQGEGLLSDTLPVGLDYVGAQIFNCGDQGPWCDFEPSQTAGRDLVWIVTPTVGMENEIRLTALISEEIDGEVILTNWAEIGSSEPVSDSEPYTDNNVDSLVLALSLPRFEVSKNYASSRVAGTEVTYIVTVDNTGAITASNVVAGDTLPQGLSYLTGDGAFDGSQVTWSFDEIGPGDSASGWFQAALPCTATFGVVNDDYSVLSSDQGVAGAAGVAVSFAVISPTIEVGIEHTPEPIVAGSVVHFTGTASTDGTALSYAWDFGDGGTATGLTATHAYTSAGEFTVTFTAHDGCGYSRSASDQITVNPPTLAASFEQSADAIFAGETIYFTDTSTTNSPPIVSWSWDFGDGGDSILQHPSHTYTVSGAYTVTLTVMDAVGDTDEASGVVLVRERAIYLPLVVLKP